MLNVKHAEVEVMCFKKHFYVHQEHVSSAFETFLNHSLDLMLLHSGLSIRSFAETWMKDAFISDENRGE
jgi:hypothetical protein